MQKYFAALAGLAAFWTAGTAAAADLNFTETFQAICGANRLDPSAAIAAARARGFTIETGPTEARIGTETQLARTDNGRRWVVRVIVKGVPPTVTENGSTTSVCSVGGQALGPTAADGLRDWVGVPPLDPNATPLVYAFREVGGRRQPMASIDNASVKAAMDSGGIYMLQVIRTNDATVVSLLRTVSSAF